MDKASVSAQNILDRIPGSIHTDDQDTSMNRILTLTLLCFLVLAPCDDSLLAQEADSTTAETSQETQAKVESDEKSTFTVNAGKIGALKFRSIGPALMSGRIGDLAINPDKPNTWYVAVASGGLWKTVNAGTTWKPIFDNYDSYSMGCVALDPNNSSTVWVGTGENVGGRHIGFGDGVYVSHDAGGSFKNMGL